MTSSVVFMSSQFVLGLDIGTSTIKAVLVDKDRGEVSEESFHPLGSKHAEVPHVSGARERKVSDIWTALEACLRDLDASKLQHVCAVGVCGQMHGCILWREEARRYTSGNDNLDQTLSDTNCSNLVTWQDERCSPSFLSSLPQSRQPAAVSAGYGCATLAWLQKYRREAVDGFSRAGTIMDFVVWRLCWSSEGRVLMSPQNATSWGYFDAQKMQWELDLLKETDFPIRLLPAIAEVPSLAGHLQASWCGVPQGTPVCVAMGDLQCAIMATNPSFTDASSASQLGVIKPSHASSQEETPLPLPPLPPSVMEVPYFHGHSLLVAASLTGANVFTELVETTRQWMTDLGINASNLPSDEELYKRLIELARENLNTPLNVRVTLWGERHCPALTGGVDNVRPGHVAMGDISSAVLRGIVENLRSMMPQEIFQALQIKRVLGSGSALQRNPALQHHARSVFNLPLELRERADAPLGAALAAKKLHATLQTILT